MCVSLLAYLRTGCSDPISPSTPVVTRLTRKHSNVTRVSDVRVHHFYLHSRRLSELPLYVLDLADVVGAGENERSVYYLLNESKTVSAALKFAQL